MLPGFVKVFNLSNLYASITGLCMMASFTENLTIGPSPYEGNIQIAAMFGLYAQRGAIPIYHCSCAQKIDILREIIQIFLTGPKMVCQNIKFCFYIGARKSPSQWLSG